MTKLTYITALFCLVYAHVSTAGSLQNGQWTYSTCGDKPTVPVVKDQDVDAYNNSVKAINTWQEQANTYYACIIAEANKDSITITNKANAEQAVYKQDVNNIVSALDAAKKKFQ
ncbi:hypothetical protein [Methylomonas sp. AM2-LC]|uniref:hypothetical protein n=1 Tax=Methylomonas sp. AM2-LC TaxID=3153301 RepID=UPI003265C2F2